MALKWPSSPRDRPPGRAPVGTIATFTFGVLYPFALLALVPPALCPWMLDIVGDAVPDAHDQALITDYGLLLIGGMIAWVVLVSPYIYLFTKRRYAGVIIFFGFGLFSAVAVPAAVVAVAIALLVSIGHEPEMVVFTYLFGTFLLVMLATWPWLVRGLRLKYWQPWTTPDQWEPGDERGAAWAMRMFNVKPLEVREAEAATKRAARRR